MFRLKDGHYITNEKGTVMTVQGSDNENDLIITEPRKDKVSQRFRVVYVDEYEEEPKKGELNKKFGLIVEEDFYIVSMLPSGRYLEVPDNRNMMIKTRNGRRQQVWYFHQQSLTIRSRINNQSFDITGSGKSNNMQIYNTNSKWW
jgi:hypothetical protein